MKDSALIPPVHVEIVVSPTHDPAQLTAWTRLWALLLREDRVSPSKGEKNNSPAPASQADAGPLA